jgi:hypothetical protein
MQGVVAIMNNRVSAALVSFPGCQRRSGRTAPYEVYVDIPLPEMRYETVAAVHRIVSHVVDVIERS